MPEEELLGTRGSLLLCTTSTTGKAGPTRTQRRDIRSNLLLHIHCMVVCANSTTGTSGQTPFSIYTAWWCVLIQRQGHQVNPPSPYTLHGGVHYFNDRDSGSNPLLHIHCMVVCTTSTTGTAGQRDTALFLIKTGGGCARALPVGLDHQVASAVQVYVRRHALACSTMYE